MIKFVGGIVVGIFVGALTVELLGRTRPELLEKIQEKARDTADRVNDFVGRPAVTKDRAY